MNSNQTALLVMDVQGSIVENLNQNKENYLKKIQKAVDFAHQNEILVIYIVVRFREGYPELNLDNRMFANIKERSKNISIDQENPLTSPVLKVTEKDLVITKKRVSAFAGNDLEMILKAKNIKKLTLCGIATSGVVLSTLRYAADQDYIITVISDCCADQDEEVHNVLINKVFPRQAEVVSLDQWISGNRELDD
jgi:nicotinamidase-related amidase